MRLLNDLISTNNLKFGEFILFQHYKQNGYNGICYEYSISKPILAIHLRTSIADMALFIDYVEYIKDDFHNFHKIKTIFEWDDAIDILGHWDYMPKYKELLSTYRNKNNNTTSSNKDDFMSKSYSKTLKM